MFSFVFWIFRNLHRRFRFQFQILQEDNVRVDLEGINGSRALRGGRHSRQGQGLRQLALRRLVRPISIPLTTHTHTALSASRKPMSFSPKHRIFS